MIRNVLRAVMVTVMVGFAPGLAWAADYPAPREADWVARDFRFHTGAVMPEMRVHYATVGAPTGEPVLVLHGTGGSGTGLLSPGFAGQLFGPGQALDATKYFVILPDSIGAGKSSKPSDGMRAGFPEYDYADMVQAQYRLLTEGLGIKHLRLVLGNSMGGDGDVGVGHPASGVHGCAGAAGVATDGDGGTELDDAAPAGGEHQAGPGVYGRQL